MGCENGEWIMRGVSADDPRRIKTADELIEYIDKVGFLPLFRNDIPNFSVEELTVAEHWWSGDERVDPWEWRGIIARSGKVAYGKFYQGKACYVSLKWFPRFVNYRRDGYDFDSRREEGLVPHKYGRIMDCFEGKEELYSNEIKASCSGEKYLDSTLGELQMMGYLVIKDFRQRINKKGQPYGWAIGVFSTPEAMWGYDFVTSAYGEEPEVSRDKLFDFILSLHPEITREMLKKAMR